MAKAYFLQDKEGNKVYPYTHADASYTRDGEIVGDKLNEVYNAKHAHSNKEVLDNTTASFTTEEKNKLANIEAQANKYTLPNAGETLGGVKTGGDLTIVDGIATVNDDSHNHVIENIDGLQELLNENLLESIEFTKTTSITTVKGNAIVESIMGDSWQRKTHYII